jgi:hypothetical protein
MSRGSSQPWLHQHGRQVQQFGPFGGQARLRAVGADRLARRASAGPGWVGMRRADGTEDGLGIEARALRRMAAASSARSCVATFS